MSLSEIIQKYLYPPIGRIVESYLEAWIDVDRILIFAHNFITYGGYVNYPRLNTTEYGLNQEHLSQGQHWYDGKYDHVNANRVNLRTGQIESYTPLSDLYQLSRGPICVGVNTINFIYQHQTEKGLKIKLESTLNLSEDKNYFSIYDITKEISAFTEPICELTESLADQSGGQIDTFEILQYHEDCLTVRLDFINRCLL